MVTDVRIDHARPMVSQRAGTTALLAAGALFVIYPALRPWGDADPGIAGAQSFAAPTWPIAHFAAVLGFVLLPAGLLALRSRIGGATTTVAVVATWLGIGLVLPYYGAEAFALNAVGERIVATGDLGLLGLIDTVRNGALQITTFGIGLVLIAIGPVLAGVAVWRSGMLARWSAVPFAAGFALFLPQFYGPPVVRIAHGVLVAVGCVVLAVELARKR